MGNQVAPELQTLNSTSPNLNYYLSNPDFLKWYKYPLKQDGGNYQFLRKWNTKEESDSSRTSIQSPVVIRSFVSHEIRSRSVHIELAERLTFHRTKVITFHGKFSSPSIGRNRSRGIYVDIRRAIQPKRASPFMTRLSLSTFYNRPQEQHLFKILNLNIE